MGHFSAHGDGRSDPTHGRKLGEGPVNRPSDPASDRPAPVPSTAMAPPERPAASAPLPPESPPSAPPTGRLPSVFDFAFLTNVQPVTELVLVRHGQQHLPDASGGPVGDIADPPLSAKGQRQAELVGKRFAGQRRRRRLRQQPAAGLRHRASRSPSTTASSRS